MKTLTPADLDLAEQFAVAFFAMATNDERGRTELEPEYIAITEHRDGPSALLRAKYSSCADLAHAFYSALGVRARWLNRDDDHDGVAWKPGVNLNYLCPPPIGRCEIAHAKLGGAVPRPGDVFVERNVYGGHVFCAVSYDPSTDVLETAEYGQPGGKRKWRTGFAKTFDAKAYSHVPLVRALELCAAPVNTAWIKNWATGELLDALEA